MDSLLHRLEPLFLEPGDGSGVNGEMLKLTREEMDYIVSEMGFERQRDADNNHIGMLKDMIVNGEWAPGSQITFAINANGLPKLVDGQHRLRAAAEAGWEGVWNIRAVFGDRQDARSSYTILDSSQKKRSLAVIGRAHGLQGMSDRMQGAALPASKYQNDWRPDYQRPEGCRYPPVRDNLARLDARLDAIREADKILTAGGVSVQTARKLYGAMVLAVVVETIHCDEEGEACDFWAAVVGRGEGVPEYLRNALLAGRQPKASQFHNPRVAGLAWNKRDAVWTDQSRPPFQLPKRGSINVQGTTLEIPD